MYTHHAALLKALKALRCKGWRLGYTRGLPYMMVGEAIYLVFEMDFDEKRVAELIRHSLLSWHFLAFVTESKNEISSVDELIGAARFLLVGAYDGESFLYTVRA